MVVCLDLGADDLHLVQLMPLPPHHLLCFIKIQIDLIFLVPAYPGCPGKEAVKRVSVLIALKFSKWIVCFLDDRL